MEEMFEGTEFWEWVIQAAIFLGTLWFVLFKWVIWPLYPKLPSGFEGRIPNGSFGWPIIGETLDFSCSLPYDYAAPRVKRYGAVFRSYMHGIPTIVVTCPALARYIYVDANQQFQMTLLTNLDILIAKNCPPYFNSEANHARIRKDLLVSLNNKVLDNWYPETRALAVLTLQGCVARENVCMFHEAHKYTLAVALRVILDLREIDPEFEALVDAFDQFQKGFVGLSYNLPGTGFRMALKARDKIILLIAGVMKRRAQLPASEKTTVALDEMVYHNILDGNALTDMEIALHVLGILFGAHHTVAVAIVWAMAHLHQNPDILKTVCEENAEVQRVCKASNTPVAWEHVKQMPYTRQVVKETLRINPPASATFRKALQDVDYGGYTIPKNWNVVTLASAIHNSEQNFNGAQKFDPSRFQEGGREFGNKYMPFGSGKHACVGRDFAMFQILTFLHQLTTNFRWVGVPNTLPLVKYPFALPSDGYICKLTSNN